MNLLTLPRTVAAIEYKALRLPATLLQSQVVVRFLEEDSKLRLGFEKTLGSLDEKAGALLANESLAERGRVLRRRSEILGKAVELEAVADQRKQAAEAVLRAGTKQAEKTRTAALDGQRKGVATALQSEQEDKRRAEQQASAQVRAEQERIVAQAQAKVDAASQRLQTQEARIEAVTRARTAAPKAQLKQAVQDKQTADAERNQAERLSALAKAEKASRKAARS